MNIKYDKLSKIFYIFLTELPMTRDLSTLRVPEETRTHSSLVAPSDARSDSPRLVFNNSIRSLKRLFQLAEQRLILCEKPER